jgi:hypothetical protein
MLTLILWIFALVFFIIAGAITNLPNPDPWRYRFICFGLACWVGGEIARSASGLLSGH